MNKLKLLLSLILLPLFIQSQITINFCPVSKTQAIPKGFNSTISITNNTGVVLDLSSNNFNMDWPGLISLPWPFSDGVQTGINWSFKLNLPWPGKLAIGSTSSVEVKDAKFSGVLQFPTSGTYKQDGKTYTVNINHCNRTDAFELYDKSIDFDRDCFIKSPTSNMCLGEAATEVWNGEGIFDVTIPKDRPSWAIGVMVAHRLFVNLTKLDIVSPNFWTATALNESRMTCDPTITPDIKNHWGINTKANLGTGVDNRTDNCFQVLNIGYVQLENNQPDLFAQTNKFGTANFNNVISGGKWETGSLAVTYYHYQNIQYWNQIKCLNLLQVYKDAKDPYTTEKILYHAFHDGFNSGTSLIEDIKSNYNNAINANNINDVIGTGGTWSNLSAGSSQKVANFTSLLDNNGAYIYNTQVNDRTTEYYGCYEESIKWSDILYYLDKIKILYPKVMDSDVETKIKNVFNSLNNGGNVPFSNLGPVIDEIVIQMGGHDPSSYLATQYSASKDCPKNPIGVSLRTNDTLCPGENGFLQVWLSGDPNFEVHIKFPDNSIRKFKDIKSSPYNIEIDQPGLYEVVYFEDLDEIGDINCNFAKIRVESKNGSSVTWDKTNFDSNKNCVNSGGLILKKTGNKDITVTYTKNGIKQPTIFISSSESSKIISTNPEKATYIITNISPNICGDILKDTIKFCSECTKPSYSILTKDTSVCFGDTAFVKISLNGVKPYTLRYKLNNIEQTPISNLFSNNLTIPITKNTKIQIYSLSDANCQNDTISNIEIKINDLPKIDLGKDTAICADKNITLNAGTGFTNYLWSNNKSSNSITVNSAGKYSVIVTDNKGCVSKDTIQLNIHSLPKVDLGKDTLICDTSSLTLKVGPFKSYLWNNGSVSNSIIVNSTGEYKVIVTDNNGCKGDDIIKVELKKCEVEKFNSDTFYVCRGDSVIIKVSNNESKKWYGDDFKKLNDSTIVVNPIKEISNFYLGDEGDIDRDSFVVILKEPIKVNIGNDTTICKNDTLLLDAGLNKSYNWSTSETTQKIKVYKQSEYRVDIIDNNGCKSSDILNLTVIDLPLIDLGDDVNICKGESFIINATDKLNYIWSNEETTQSIKVSDSGSYWVKVTDNNGCSNKDTINVLVNNPPIINLSKDTTICLGSEILLTAPENLRYQWSNGETTRSISVKNSGNYSITVYDNINCSSTDNINVKLDSIKDIFSEKEKKICKNDTITLKPDEFNGYDISWNGIKDSIIVYLPGTYISKVSNKNCTKEFEIKVTEIESPDIYIFNKQNKTEFCFVYENPELELIGDLSDVLITWYPSLQRGNSISIDSAGTYTVYLKKDNCVSVSEITFTEFCEEKIFISSGFTPNGDGLNDVFKPILNYIKEYELLIFNRWGQQIFSSNDINIGWDGTYLNNKCQQDVYVYKINYINESKQKRNLVGLITLIR